MCVSSIVRGEPINSLSLKNAKQTHTAPKKTENNIIESLTLNLKDESKVTSKTPQKANNTNISFVDDSTKADNVKLKVGDSWNGGKVIANNVDPTAYRNVSKGIEGGVFDTAYDKAKYQRLQSQEKKGKVPAGTAEAYKKDHLLQNLQDFLSGKADHVSLAFDKELYKNGSLKKGQKFRIPELEKAYGKSPIIFRADDTGSAFTNKGLSRIDICTKDAKDPKTGALYQADPRLNVKGLTLVKIP